MSQAAPRVLVAGVGNVFLGDDGFGVEVARRLAAEPLPAWAQVADYGIRGVHLAFELLDGYDAAILVDATPRGGPPGTLYVLELDQPGDAAAGDGAPLVDAHGMEPGAALGLLGALGGSPARLFLVGCEPSEVGERMGLSEPVARAVDDAVRAVRDLLEELHPEGQHAQEEG